MHYSPEQPLTASKPRATTTPVRELQPTDPYHQIIPGMSECLYPTLTAEYGLFEDTVDSYYLDSQIKDDFHCDQDCYTHQQESTVDNHSISCTHAYNHIVQQIQDLSDSTQQHTSTLHGRECIIIY